MNRLCILCDGIVADGEREAHDESLQHQRGTALFCLYAVEQRGLCPWCQPTGRQKFVLMNHCRDATHAAKLARCRELAQSAS